MFYTFYGDDFTGSTDVLEQLALKGVRAVLFLRLPTETQFARFADVEAVGLAGDSRSRPPEWMDAHLPSIFEFLKSRRAAVNHYKVCSTFDSGPERGSTGCAMEIGRRIFAPEFVPIVVGAPHLRRYVVFGNLFALDPDGSVKRIDRHAMSRHPATAMREADLRRHLAEQTAMPVGLVDLPSLRAGKAEEVVRSSIEAGAEAVLFDGFDEDDLRRTGELLMAYADKRPLFVVGSSGATAAVLAARPEVGLKLRTYERRKTEGPLLVVSGSCSRVTMGQIEYAVEHGFRAAAIDAEKLCTATRFEEEAGRVHDAAVEALAAGESVAVYTPLGPREGRSVGNELGGALGVLLRRILRQSGQRRVLLCGGDTSSHAVNQLGCYALTWLGATEPGAPLCRVHSDDAELDGLELVLKGGQVGSREFFELVRRL